MQECENVFHLQFSKTFHFQKPSIFNFLKKSFVEFFYGVDDAKFDVEVFLFDAFGVSWYEDSFKSEFLGFYDSLFDSVDGSDFSW